MKPAAPVINSVMLLIDWVAQVLVASQDARSAWIWVHLHFEIRTSSQNFALRG
jgi:hypothetical protein